MCEHIAPILASLQRLPAQFQIRVKILLFVFISLNGRAPPYLAQLLHPYAPDQMLLSNSKQRGERSCVGCKKNLWNDLPLHVRQTPSLAVVSIVTATK